MDYDKKSKCYFYVDKTHSYLHYEVFDRTGKHIGVIDGEELKEALKSGKEIKKIVNKKGVKLGRTANTIMKILKKYMIKAKHIGF